jgi:hypothetical protein
MSEFKSTGGMLLSELEKAPFGIDLSLPNLILAQSITPRLDGSLVSDTIPQAACKNA